MSEARRVKPRHLGADYAAQFGDEEVAAAYRHRPPYPAETFTILEPLLGPRPRGVLELGAGTGDLTIGLAPLVDALTAIEPSRSMLERARRRDGLAGTRIEWLGIPAEAHAFERSYSAVVAAESVHWLDWPEVLPRIARSLAPDGRLILVERALAAALPWDPDLGALIREYSTNRDYVPYDAVAELEARGLMAVGGRAQTGVVPYHQRVGEYVESFHSRNGFSRARLPAGRAREFDDKLEALVRLHCPDGTVCLPVQARVVWSRP